jgi:hypothetical protein
MKTSNQQSPIRESPISESRILQSVIITILQSDIRGFIDSRDPPIGDAIGDW